MRKGESSVVLHQDILYKEIGYSVTRAQSISNIEILNYLIHSDGGKIIELSETEFRIIWDEILSYSDSEVSFKYLRESVDNITHLGKEILKDILAIK